MQGPFKHDSEVLDLVRRFELCEINPEDFRHYQHLTVALYYVRKFPYELASQKVRNGIQKLAAAHEKSGYHETITMFWLMVVHEFLATVESSESMCDVANRFVASCTGPTLINDFYSKALLSTKEARCGWVEPDLKPLSGAMESVPSA